MIARILSEPVFAAGGSVDLRRIRLRDRFLAVLGASRTASGHAGNARDISASLSPRYAIDETGERDEMVRIPRTRTAVLRVDEVPVRNA